MFSIYNIFYCNPVVNAGSIGIVVLELSIYIPMRKMIIILNPFTNHLSKCYRMQLLYFVGESV
jgi:hypothetical protein